MGTDSLIASQFIKTVSILNLMQYFSLFPADLLVRHVPLKETELVAELAGNYRLCNPESAGFIIKESILQLTDEDIL